MPLSKPDNQHIKISMLQFLQIKIHLTSFMYFCTKEILLNPEKMENQNIKTQEKTIPLRSMLRE
jgi:hypothetical protein